MEQEKPKFAISMSAHCPICGYQLDTKYVCGRLIFIHGDGVYLDCLNKGKTFAMKPLLVEATEI